MPIVDTSCKAKFAKGYFSSAATRSLVLSRTKSSAGHTRVPADLASGVGADIASDVAKQPFSANLSYKQQPKSGSVTVSTDVLAASKGY